MNISIFGLGYVGSVLSGCLAALGHHVVGVDVDAGKVAAVNAGRSPIVEPGLEALVAAGVRSGRLRATTDPRQAVIDTDVTMACVGTPSGPDGDLDLTFIRRACETIGDGIRGKSGRHLVVFRSTLLPGTLRGVAIPLLEGASGKRAGEGFGVAINPEFMRESTAVHDFHHPPKTVIGALMERDADVVASLYEHLEAPLIRTTVEVAEMVKYVDNVFHALKITFANEVGSLCSSVGVDGREVMGIFCQDRKLNISPAYLRPGFSFGGSCLPKDLRALEGLARRRGVEVPLLGAIGVSNRLPIEAARRMIGRQGRRRVGILGFAFKSGTDDLRESPVLTLAQQLVADGHDLRLHDPCVSLVRLVGANLRYLTERLEPLSRMVTDSIDEVLEHGELIVVGNPSPEFDGPLERLPADRVVLDLTARATPLVLSARVERL